MPGDENPGAAYRQAKDLDRVVARLGAVAYLTSAFPAAVRVWGWPDEVAQTVGTDPPAPGFRPDDLDGLWERTDADGPHLLAVTATAGGQSLPEITGYACAGTRDYLRAAAERLHKDGTRTWRTGSALTCSPAGLSTCTPTR